MAYPPVVIVDEQDRPIGTAMLREAWAKALRYRVVAVLVEDEAGRILLQKRAAGMEIDPGRWDISVGGHVDEGQTYESAAAAELHEELGLGGLTLRPIGVEFFSEESQDRHMNNFLKVFKVVISGQTEFRLGQTEVSDAQWFTPEEFAALLRDHPEQCSKFLKDIRSRFSGLFAPAPALVA
ncbi:MAG TPA: NUDIX domain-containing protein [Candidatus Pristimantibacillus sp.]|jgi:isopentenyldiphosphate isomerase|nr:NUDIX domain-containing protein [Candidatus Pristimantibacillus sp.]